MSILSRYKQEILIIIALLLFLINFFLYKSLVIGVAAFLFYLLLTGYLAKCIFFQETYGLLLGVYFVICIIVVAEAILLILKLFIIPYILFPYIFTLLVLWIAINKTKTENINSYGNFMQDFSNNRYLYVLYILSLLTLFSLLFLARTGKPVFSIVLVVNPLFWLLWAVSICILVVISYVKFTRREGEGLILLLVSIHVFMFFGVYLISSEYGADADPYAWTGFIRILLTSNSREEPWIYILSERGLEALVASFVKTSITSEYFDPLQVRFLIDSINPMLASLYIPLFTFLLTVKITEARYGRSLPVLSSLCAILMFPTFFDFAITNPNWMSGIFLLGTIYLCAESLHSPLKILFRSKHTIPLVLSFLATILIHPIGGIYAAAIAFIFLSNKMVFLLKQKIPNSVIKIIICDKLIFRINLSKTTFSLLCLVLTIVICSFVPSIAILHGHEILAPLNPKVNPVAIWEFSSERLVNFFSFSPSFDPSTLVPAYNWIRITVVMLSIIMMLKNEYKGNIHYFVISIAVFSILSWLVFFAFLVSPYGYFRISFMVDLILLPLVSALLSNGIYLSLKKKASTVLFTVLLTVSLVASTITTFSIPSQNYIGFPPTPGRPTFRFVAAQEIEAISYISKSEGNYLVIASDEFLYKLTFPFIDVRVIQYRYLNLIAAPQLIYDLIVRGEMTKLYQIAKATNSTYIFILFNDWFIKKYNIANIELALQNLKLEEVHIFGDEYRVFLLKIKI